MKMFTVERVHNGWIIVPGHPDLHAPQRHPHQQMRVATTQDELMKIVEDLSNPDIKTKEKPNG